MCVLFERDCAPDRAVRHACILNNTEGEANCEAQLEVVDKIEKKEKEEASHFWKHVGGIEIY